MAARRRSIAKRIEGTKPSLPLAAYAGSYGCKPYGKAQIELKDGALELRLLSHPYVGRLSHWHGDVFMARWTDPVWNESAVFFDLNGRGEIGTFRIRIRPEWIDPVEYRFQKR